MKLTVLSWLCPICQIEVGDNFCTCCGRRLNATNLAPIHIYREDGTELGSAGVSPDISGLSAAPAEPSAAVVAPVGALPAEPHRPAHPLDGGAPNPT